MQLFVKYPILYESITSQINQFYFSTMYIILPEAKFSSQYISEVKEEDSDAHSNIHFLLKQLLNQRRKKLLVHTVLVQNDISSAFDYRKI